MANIPGVPFKLSAQDMSVPDYGSAIREGLQNYILQNQAKYAPQKEELGIKKTQTMLEAQPILNQLRMAQAARANQLASDPFGGHVPSGAAGESYWMAQLKNRYGSDSDIVKNAQKQLDLENELKQSNITRRSQINNAQAYSSLPADEKKRVVATAVGMGYDPSEASRLLNSGKTLSDMSQEKGIDLKEVQPVYPLGGETLKQMQKRGAFANEIKVLQTRINEATKGYGRRLAGYSPKQVMDAISNENPDQQGRYLAARALAPELNALRLNAMNGKVGIEAIKHLTEKAGQNSKVFESLISDDARQSMNNYMSQWIDEAQNAYSDNLQDYAALGKGPQLRGKKEDEVPETNIPKGAGKIMQVKGGEVAVPADAQVMTINNKKYIKGIDGGIYELG